MRCSQFAVIVFVLVANVALSDEQERRTGERLRQLLNEASPKSRAIAGHAEKSRAAYVALKNELSSVCQYDPADLPQEELVTIAVTVHTPFSRIGLRALSGNCDM